MYKSPYFYSISLPPLPGMGGREVSSWVVLSYQ